MTTLAVLLAAGAGTRFGGPTHKLRAPLGDGRTVAEHSIAAARAAAIGPLAVVLGAVDLDLADDVTVLRNPAWADGQAGSLRIAVAEAERIGAAAVVVGLADQPGVTPEAWQLGAAGQAPITVATYTDSGPHQPRNPVRLHRSVWPLLPTAGDHGARELIRSRPELVERVPCPGSAADVDSLADLIRVRRQARPGS